MRIWLSISCILFIYLSVYFNNNKKKTRQVCKRKSLRHRFCRVEGKVEVAVAELFLVRANHELNITPPSTRNRTENLKEGELDLQRAYGAESSSPPRPHQVFFSRINKIPPFSQSSLSLLQDGIWHSAAINAVPNGAAFAVNASVSSKLLPRVCAHIDRVERCGSKTRYSEILQLLMTL